MRGGGLRLEMCCQHGSGIEFEDQHQHLQEGERGETLAALQTAHVPWGDVVAEEGGAALG
jgi:hypothetical protein